MAHAADADIYALLGLRASASAEDVARAYHRLRARVHPGRAGTGSTAAFVRLEEAYARFRLGDDAAGCLAVCTSAPVAQTRECRCGSRFEIPPGARGRVECDACSCFLYVEAPPPLLGTAPPP